MKRIGRTGTYEPQPGRFKAFVPKPLPFGPPLQYEGQLLVTLSKADLAIGQLNAAAAMLPNPELFVAMYVKKESVLSSRLEGVTQASLGEVLEHEARSRNRLRGDIKEVLNHVNATSYGLARLKEIPLSNRLIREIHAQLMADVRGADKDPGQFRTEQNWIGPPGCDVHTATFVPPPPDIMQVAIGNLEAYFHDDTPIPPLVKAGLIHYQFETIHPFLDGNGRLGRLLVTFFLCEQNILKRPLLYLSEFIDAFKDDYYERLQSVRDTGAVEEWMEFFLTAVWRVAESASETASKILALREGHRTLIHDAAPSSGYPLKLLDYLFAAPFITINEAKEHLAVSYPTASNVVGVLERLKIVEEITGQERNRLYMYGPYLSIMETGRESGQEDAERKPYAETVSA